LNGEECFGVLVNTHSWGHALAEEDPFYKENAEGQPSYDVC